MSNVLQAALGPQLSPEMQAALLRQISMEELMGQSQKVGKVGIPQLGVANPAPSNTYTMENNADMNVLMALLEEMQKATTPKFGVTTTSK